MSASGNTKRWVFVLLVLSIVIFGLVLSGCAREEEAEEVEYRIGIVFDVGGRGDRSFNDSAYEGLVLIAEEFDGYIADDPDDVDYGTEVELKYLEPRQGGQDREQLLRVLAEDGYDLLYGVGFAFTDALGKVAADFPDTHFALIDGYIPDLGADSNITCIAFAEHEGSFMVGALAAMYLQDNGGGRLGFIGGMDIPLIHKFHGGFMAGAMYVDEAHRPEGEIFGQYIGQDPTAFNDPQTAENIARNMYDEGAEIIYHAAGGSGTGLFKAAYDMGKLAIGVDSDQGLVYAEAENAQERAVGEQILTSMLKRVDIGVFLLAEDFIQGNGDTDGGYVSYGLDDNGVGYAVNDYNRDTVAPYQDRLDALKAEVVNGDIVVPESDTEIPEWREATF
jgi:basic membrane protein A and related proteins